MANARSATRVPTTAEEKERRAQDAALAMRQYEEQNVAMLANMARLRALRLEREAVAAAAPAPEPVKKVKKRA
jgi:hypothetical protein